MSNMSDDFREHGNHPTIVMAVNDQFIFFLFHINEPSRS